MSFGVLRRGLPRDVRATTYLVGFVVSTVATILIVRGALALSGYPKIGGNGLHIAHVLWGGLLMALSIVLAMSFIGQVVRPFVAIVSGIGFGLFLDEVGKFVTSTSNYFFQPAVAIMYLTVVLLVLLIHMLHGRTPPRSAEFLAAGLAEATAATGGGISDQRRDRALGLIDLARDEPGATEAAAMVRALPVGPKELADPLVAARRVVQRVGQRIVTIRFVRWLTVAVLVVLSFLELTVTLAVAILDLFKPGTLNENIPNYASLGGTVSACAASICVLIGLRNYRRDKRAAYGWFQRAVLIDLLLTQVFTAVSDQFSAIPSIVIDLVMLAVLGAARSQYSQVPTSGTFTLAGTTLPPAASGASR